MIRVQPAETDPALQDQLPGEALPEIDAEQLQDGLPEQETLQPGVQIPVREEYTPDQIDTLNRQTDKILQLLAQQGASQLPGEHRARFVAGLQRNMPLRYGLQVSGLPEIVNRYMPLEGGTADDKPVYFRPPPLIENLPEWGRCLLGIAVMGISLAIQTKVIAREIAADGSSGSAAGSSSGYPGISINTGNYAGNGDQHAG